MLKGHPLSARLLHYAVPTQCPVVSWLLLQPKPEVGIQFGAGGTSTVGSLAAEGTRDVKQLVSACRAFKEHVSV